jgi:signal transduction histidine kinase/ActR/RegA family two-component response regulator
MLTFSDEGTILYANARLHALLEQKPGSLLHTHFDRVLAPASRVFHTTHFFPLLKLHGRVEEIHVLLRTASGVDVPVLVSAVRETSGEMALNHCSLMTMCRRKEFEVALVDARKQAEAATAAKDQFLAVVSHELRTPLSAITGWLRLARSGKLDPVLQQRALETIDRNAQLQAQLIDDLLDVSRIVSGKMRISPRPINLASVVESAIDTARPSAQAKEISLVLSIERDAGIVPADPARVQQIVWNLVSNAVKFTPKGGQVQVTLARVGSRVRVEVADTGPGIEPAQLPYVFNRFWQADLATPKEHSGLGLGLSICKSLVELHGGSIRAESPGAGHGAVFTVEFPLAVVGPVGDATDATTAAAHGAAASRASIDGIRVLVVDDDVNARTLLKMLLEDAGALVNTAASADEAIARVRRDVPQVVVSDIGMPGKDGYALIRELRADRTVAQQNLAAIAITGLARPDDRVNMLRAGFQAHLVKPVEPAEVIALVGALAAPR